MGLATVYDASLRNNGTAVLCWDSIKRGLGFGEELNHYAPNGELPKEDLYLYIDDGRDDNSWVCPKPNAYYAIDTHLGYGYRRWKAEQYDWVFCAQQDGAVQMHKDGIKNVEWLPLACHPPSQPNLAEMLAHPSKDSFTDGRPLDKQFDLAFVGYMNEGAGENSNNRLDYLDILFKAFPESWMELGAFFEAMAVPFIRARLGFNISIKQDLNMRFFEIPSTGTCMLTNRNVYGWEDLGFEEGKHFIGYEGPEEMIEQAQWGLDHPTEREAIAAEAHEFVRANHTYAHRMKIILDKFGIKPPEVPA